MELYCPQCSDFTSDSPRVYCCPSCGGPLACAQEPASFPKERLGLRPYTPWRYAEALPEWAGQLFLGEVISPLVPFDVGGRSVLFKCDQAQPTGSYKDRGAELVSIEGPRPNATEALFAYIDQSDAVYASHLWNPLFIYGIQTLAFELVEQLEWQAPDAVFCPVGAGSILLGLYEGFTRMHAVGATAYPDSLRYRPNASLPSIRLGSKVRTT